MMKFMVGGKTNKEIGASVRITEGTVKIHVRHMLKKLGAGGRTEAIRIALERGIVHLRPGHQRSQQLFSLASFG